MDVKKIIRRHIAAALRLVLSKAAVDGIRRRQVERKWGSTAVGFRRASYRPSRRYAIVSAVYNAEEYLNDFFESIFAQTMDCSMIRLILVDDGSTDSSAEVIRRWRDCYEGVIEYLYKENGGQASARNLGLRCLEDEEWVTFVDPDDFISANYFELVDRAIEKTPSVQMVSCSTILFYEDLNTYRNGHPLRGRFDLKEAYYSIEDDSHPIQLSMSSVFFRRDRITEMNLTLDERVRPNFEDGHFVNRYMLGLEEGHIAFLRDPEYYYRKRKADNSTLNTSWSKEEKYTVLPRRGYLDLLAYAKEKKGYVPRYIQNTVLYDLTWFFRRCVGDPETTLFLEERNANLLFIQSIKEIMSFIDKDVLFEFPEKWIDYNTKASLVKVFCGMKPDFVVAYVVHIETDYRRMLIRSIEPNISFSLDGRIIEPREMKWSSQSLAGIPFVDTYEFWLPYENESQILAFRSDDLREVSLSVRDTLFEEPSSMKEIINLHTNRWCKFK